MTSRREFLHRAAAVVVGAGSTLASCRPAPETTHPRLSADAGRAIFEGSVAGEGREIEGLGLCWCPPGDFVMGSAPGEVGRRPDEAQVSVTLSRGFWLGRAEVTQGDWWAVMGMWPDRPPSSRFGEGADHPVYWVTYTQAEAFCERVGARAGTTGSLPRGWSFRLPTEAQWEYACRAGTLTATAFGDRLTPGVANYAEVPVGAGRAAEAVGSSKAVASHPANPWGLHDMHGNVWEWCRDWYHARLPGGLDPDLSAIPGVRNGDGSYSRVRRGGAWIEGADLCRSATRLRYEPHRSSDHIGFRVAVVQD